MVSFAYHGPEETDADRVAILLIALEQAIKVVEASDTLLSLFDPRYDGKPPCIEVWKELIASIREDVCCPERTGGDE